jgi:hypothetical protein
MSITLSQLESHLWESANNNGVPRGKARAAIKLGVKTGAIVTAEGPKNAILHRRS